MRRKPLISVFLLAFAGCTDRPTQQPPAEVAAIVFCRGGTVMCWLTAVNPDGTGARRLSLDPPAEPAWSPDGKRIAFINWKDQNAELHVWNADGSTRRLTHSGGRRALHVVNADGSGIRAIASDSLRNLHPSWRP